MKKHSQIKIILKNIKDRFGIDFSIIDQLKFSPILAQLIVTRKCNLECGYCTEFDKTSDPVPQEILFKRIEKIKQLGTVSVEFSGGEPLLHPKIYDVVKFATDQNFIARMLITNAYLLTEDSVKKLNDGGLTHMQVSIDGVFPNDVTIKVLKPLRKKLEMLAKLNNFKVTVNSVIGASPAEEAEEVFDFATEIGFVPRVLVVHDSEGQMKLSEENFELYKKLKNKISKSPSKKNYTDKLLSGETAPFKCRGGSRYLYIDEFGFVHYCSQKMDLYKKDIMELDLNELRTNFYTKHPCSDYCTIGCARNSSSLDEWRKQ
jgi:MoaA/NifB/PqqE/SkfB family radical SAM enzyme